MKILLSSILNNKLEVGEHLRGIITTLRDEAKDSDHITIVGLFENKIIQYVKNLLGGAYEKLNNLVEITNHLIGEIEGSQLSLDDLVKFDDELIFYYVYKNLNKLKTEDENKNKVLELIAELGKAYADYVKDYEKLDDALMHHVRRKIYQADNTAGHFAKRKSHISRYTIPVLGLSSIAFALIIREFGLKRILTYSLGFVGGVGVAVFSYFALKMILRKFD